MEEGTEKHNQKEKKMGGVGGQMKNNGSLNPNKRGTEGGTAKKNHPKNDLVPGWI